MMKKSLVTLATLAVAGTASAQSTVTITGKYGFAYVDTTDAGAAGAKTNGFQTSDGNVIFAATEDLGGGLKAGVSMDLKLRGRAADGVSGRDASIYVLTPVGQITAGSVESGNGILPLGSAGAPVIGLDIAAPQLPKGGLSRSPLDGGVNTDFVSYTAAFSGLQVTLGVFDSITIGATGAGGWESSSATRSAVALSMKYSQGPLSLAGDYAKYNLNTPSTAVAQTFFTMSRTRISGSYDLGVVKLGAGYQIRPMRFLAAGVLTGDDIGNRQYVLGISAPVASNLTVGAVYSRNSQDAVLGTASNDITGYDLGVQYDLSKRTGLNVAYQRAMEDDKPGAFTTFRIRLLHKF